MERICAEILTQQVTPFPGEEPVSAKQDKQAFLLLMVG